ncbi:MAG: hypothetical protein M3158_03065 [Pseudomonadota bacterium]|nr:hypothetical protein [Pseudomonadota bacterium]
MTDISLEELADRIRKKGRIGKYDVEAMRLEILKDGLGSRAEAELLIVLDRTVASVHFSWSAYFAAALADFVVWKSEPAGYMDAAKSQWILPLLTGEGATGRATRALVAIAQEAECFDEAFFVGSAGATPNRRVSQPGQDLACAA